ncbi:MAG TPA: hypothetical protein VID68_13815 [Solirubrobacteraceae bacterium]|jgi:uridine phosphorylase
MPAATTFSSANSPTGKGSQNAIIARLTDRPASGAHIRATAPLAPRALLCADPGRALALAQELLAEPRMFNHNHGLWGYSGAATVGDRGPLTIQSTGIGGPSAAVVLEELIALGLERAVYVGEAIAIAAEPGLLIASRAICEDGAARALAGGEGADVDGGLLAALRRAAPSAAVGAVVSADLLYGEPAPQRRLTAGALAFDMQAATLIALGAARARPVGCLLAIGGDGLAAAARAAVLAL